MELIESENKNLKFITCLTWVKRGVAKENPTKVEIKQEDLINIIKDTKRKLVLADAETDGASTSNTEEPAVTTTEDEFNLEDYDDDDEEKTALEELGIHSLAEVNTEAEDFPDDDSENEDDIIKPSDNLIAVGKIIGDTGILEVYVYNEEEGSLYCHHDLFLPNLPLCIEWLDCEPGGPQGNFCAIGTMDPIIDVWDLDLVNCIEPAFSLGRKARPKKRIDRVGHTDAVLDLSWNSMYHHIIASGSADHTVLIWDIEVQEPKNKLTAFKEKVQSIVWNLEEPKTLLTGSSDKSVKIFDCRTPDKFLTWELDDSVEKVTWFPKDTTKFMAGTSSGMVYCIDSRKGTLWSHKAHESDITGLIIDGKCPGLLVTTSADELLKVWDVSEKINQVFEKDLKMGIVHCLELCPDIPLLTASGGNDKSNNFTVLNLQSIDTVDHHFAARINTGQSMDTEES